MFFRFSTLPRSEIRCAYEMRVMGEINPDPPGWGWSSGYFVVSLYFWCLFCASLFFFCISWVLFVCSFECLFFCMFILLLCVCVVRSSLFVDASMIALFGYFWFCLCCFFSFACIFADHIYGGAL